MQTIDRVRGGLEHGFGMLRSCQFPEWYYQSSQVEAFGFCRFQIVKNCKVLIDAASDARSNLNLMFFQVWNTGPNGYSKRRIQCIQSYAISRQVEILGENEWFFVIIVPAVIQCKSEDIQACFKALNTITTDGISKNLSERFNSNQFAVCKISAVNEN
jgi:hypothetical protein